MKLSHIRAPIPMSSTLPRYESLVHMLLAAVDCVPEVPAVIYLERRINYAELGRAVAGLTRQLARGGHRRGMRVIVMMPNSIEMDVALMAVMATRAQVAPANPFLMPGELKKVLADMDASMIISDASSAQKAGSVAQTSSASSAGRSRRRRRRHWTAVDRRRDARDRSGSLPGPTTLRCMIFTGGSTGIPKGVNHTHRGLCGRCCSTDRVACAAGGEMFLNVAPMFHIWGLAYATWVPIYMQSTLVMIPRYDPDKVVQALADYKVTMFAGGPAPIYMGLLASPLFDRVDLANLRYCLSGGAPCPEELHREWHGAHGHASARGLGDVRRRAFLPDAPGPRSQAPVGWQSGA